MDSCFAKDTRIVTRCIAGETVIVPIRHDTANLDSIYTLNEIGTVIWNLLDQQASFDQMVQSIAGEYEVSTEQAAEDIDDFLQKLQAAELIHPAANPPSHR